MKTTACLAICLLPFLAACGGSEPAPKTPETPSTSSATSTAVADAPTEESPAPTQPADDLVGKPAPSIDATAHDGTKVATAKLVGKPVVVYFYPKDETPGCTKQACAFRDAWKDLAKADVVLVGISTDTVESHKAFAEHHKLPFHLVSDPDGAIAKKFGVPNNGGFLARHTIVIGKDGTVKKVYRDVDVSKHASEVLADVRS